MNKISDWIYLWWLGLVRPGEAFEAIRDRPAPSWGFWIVVVFNITISLTTDLVRWLTGGALVLPSWLTFLPEERYLFAELFFLPVLRILVALLDAAIVHIFLRLIQQPSDFDRQINLGGMGYLVVMPVIFITDWIFLAFGRYELATYTHSLVLPWSIFLSVIGLRKFFGLRTGIALAAAAMTLLTLPLLSIFAR